jgi:hypothetical protein
MEMWVHTKSCRENIFLVRTSELNPTLYEDQILIHHISQKLIVRETNQLAYMT